jgi:multidrug resistance protein
MKNKPLLVIFLTIFIDLLGFGLVIPILPIYAQELGASAFSIGAIVASFSIMQFFFAPMWGNLSDRIGRRPVLMGSMALMSVSYLLFAYAHTLVLLFAARTLAGIASANLSAAQAYISDISTPENRAKNFGLIGAAFGLGFIFGPPVGGFLKSRFGIEYVGFAAAGLSAMNLLLAAWILPESLKERNPKARLFNNPLADVWAGMKKPALRELLVMNLVFITAFSIMQITSSLLWHDAYGLNDEQIGYMFAFIGISVAVIQGTMIGYFQRKVGEKRLLLAGNVLMGVGLVSLPFVPPALFIPLELVCLLLIAFGNSFLTPTIMSMLSRRADGREQGKVLGVNQSVASISRVAGPLIGGAAYGLGPHQPYLISGALMLATTWMAIKVVRQWKN